MTCAWCPPSVEVCWAGTKGACEDRAQDRSSSGADPFGKGPQVTLLEAQVPGHPIRPEGARVACPPGDGNEAIGGLIQSYIREIEELR